MKILFSSRCVALTGLLILSSGSPLLACSACYSGNADNRMGNAATWGIIAMTIIMFAMLGAVGAFIWHLAYRAKHPLPDYEELLTENEGQPGTTP